MTALWIILSLIGGVGVGTGVMWFYLSGKLGIAGERIRQMEVAAQEAGAIQAERDNLRVKVAEVERDIAGRDEKLTWVDRARQEMEQAFAALAAKALRESTGQVMSAAKDSIIKPLEVSLTKLDAQVRDLESKRAGAYGEMLTQLKDVQKANSELIRSTTTLSEALRSSSTRGKWGELQLRRVVEMAGLTKHVDFVEQSQVAGERPDMVVNLPNGGSLPVDAKAPMNAYLDSLNMPSGDAYRAKLEEHANALRSRIRDLGQKSYWKQFERAPEFVVMFIPVEACLSAAFEMKPDLLEYAIEQKVLVCSPVTLLALLKTVAFGFQQQAMTSNVKEIQRQNQELYARLIPWLEHEKDVGVKLDAAVKAFNSSVGSLHGRVLPAAEKLRELGVATEELPSPRPIEQQVRAT